MRSKGKGQTKYNRQWVNEQQARRHNLEQEFRTTGGEMTKKHRHLVTEGRFNHDALRAN